MKHSVLLMFFGLLLCVAPYAGAHHSAAAHFDVSKTITVEGTITEFQYVDPHSYVFFNVVNPDGGKPIAWRCEIEARTALGRRGWTKTTLAPGQKMTFKGYPARREDHVCALTSFIGPDSIEHSAREDFAKGTSPLDTLAERNKAPRPERLPNGRPNFTGQWMSIGPNSGDQPRSFFDPRGGNIEGLPKDKLPGGGATPTPAGEAAAKKYDMRFDDPALRCTAANILFAWLRDRHVNEILQTDDTLTLKYGYMNLTRTIHLNMKEHPKNITPSIAGNSIGNWEGDVLVVDTIGFKPGVLVPLTGLQHSAQMHAVERYTLDNTARTLTRDYRADDPLYLSDPFKGLDVMKMSDEPFTSYKCVELSGKNNIRPK